MVSLSKLKTGLLVFKSLAHKFCQQSGEPWGGSCPRQASD